MMKLLLISAVLSLGCEHMAEQLSSKPYEEPQYQPASGAVSVEQRQPQALAEAGLLTNPLPRTAAIVDEGRAAYRRYCHHCHGPKLDGNGAVGPSLLGGNMNLLAPEVARQTDGEICWKTVNGWKLHPPLGATMTSDEAWQVVSFIRSLQTRQEGR